jgi:hypothetical protein
VDLTVKIYVNGLLADPATYDVHIDGGWVRFHPTFAPPLGQVVTMDCDFDIPVRFDLDDLKLTLFWVKAGQIPHVPVTEVRDVINQAPTDYADQHGLLHSREHQHGEPPSGRRCACG